MTKAVSKPGPLAVLDLAENRETFLHALDVSRGNLTEACRRCDLARDMVYRAIRLNPEFAQQIDAIQSGSRRRVSANLHNLAQDHLQSHLEHSWIPLVDEDGLPVLDEEFEQVRVSALSPKAIVDSLKETRQAVEGESPVVALQVNSNADGETATFVAVKSRATEELMAAYGLTDDEHAATDDDYVIDADFEETAPWDD